MKSRIFLLLFVSTVYLSANAQSWTTGSTIYWNGTGNAGIGTTAPGAKLEIVGPGSGSTSNLIIRNNSSSIVDIYASGNADYFMGGFFLNRSRGTSSAPTAMMANDRIGAFGARAFINGAYQGLASIQMFVGAGPGTNSYPSYMTFGTIPTNSTTMVERMRITESGFIGIGKTTPSYLLDVNGTINATGIYVNGAPFSGSRWTLSGANINYTTGSVSIGTTSTPAGYKLAVGGKVVAEEIVVKLQGNWPDYVFGSDYKLLSLPELQQYILEHRHLPDVPSAHEVAESGVEVGEMTAVLLKKIEELTLHIIDQQKKIEVLQAKLGIE